MKFCKLENCHIEDKNIIAKCQSGYIEPICWRGWLDAIITLFKIRSVGVIIEIVKGVYMVFLVILLVLAIVIGFAWLKIPVFREWMTKLFGIICIWLKIKFF